LLGGLQLPPKRRAHGVDADAQPVRRTADAAWAAGKDVGGQGGGDHGAAVRRRPCPTTRYKFLSDALKSFLFGYLLVLERYAGNGATL
jgi:hypothetical protein